MTKIKSRYESSNFKYLAISSANLTAVLGFNAPFLFMKSRRSPCTTGANEIYQVTVKFHQTNIPKNTPKIMSLEIIGQNLGKIFCHNHHWSTLCHSTKKLHYIWMPNLLKQSQLVSESLPVRS